MKVLHIFNEINFSGAELMYNDASSYFQSRGVELFAISTGKTIGSFAENFKKSGINAYHKHYKTNIVLTISGIKFYWFLFKFLKKKKIDVVHIHKSSIFFAAVITFILNIKCVKTAHSVFENRQLTKPIAILRRRIISNIFKTRYHSIGESVYLNELNYYKNPSIKINNWYNHNRFYPRVDGEKKAIRKLMQIPEDIFVVISVGSCLHVKNHHDILKALSLLKNNLNFLYLHLGDGPMQRDEQELASSLGLQNDVIFLGNKNNVRDYLIAADVYVMTSRYEGLSISCLEVMATGIPVILYDVVGLRDLIKSDNNGFLIESKPEVLAEKIVVYAENNNIAESKAINASSFVKDNFNLKLNVDLMIKLYKS